MFALSIALDDADGDKPAAAVEDFAQTRASLLADGTTGGIAGIGKDAGQNRRTGL